jgi:hypothetical protein
MPIRGAREGSPFSIFTAAISPTCPPLFFACGDISELLVTGVFRKREVVRAPRDRCEAIKAIAQSATLNASTVEGGRKFHD